MAYETTLVRLGFDFTASRTALLLPCLVTPVLYLGPLYAYWLSGSLPFQCNWSWRWSFLPLFTTLQGVRNYVVVSALVLAIPSLVRTARRALSPRKSSSAAALSPSTISLARRRRR